MMREHIRTIMDWLTGVGADLVRLEYGGKHPRIAFSYEGRNFCHTVPHSPGDTMRGAQNGISEIRRQLGLAASEKHTGERRPRKTGRQPAPAALDQRASPIPDWRDQLREHPLCR